MSSVEDFLAEVKQQVEEEIVQLRASISPESAEENAIKIALAQHRYAKLLCSIGMQREALAYLQPAWQTAMRFVPPKQPVELPAVVEVYGLAAYTVGADLALVLDYLAQTADCERVFDFLNNSHYSEGPHLGGYAFFLHRRKRDFDRAEKVYKTAIELFPDHSSIYLKYAGFLRHVRRNISAAEEFYKLSAALCDDGRDSSSPSFANAADAFGSYASFLHGVHRRIEQAEHYYKKAVQADPTHANNLCNYGLFLSEEKKDYEGAEQMYQTVLRFTPNHANTLYNYAVLLDTQLKRKEEAERFYRSTLELEPKHAYALYNLAVLVEERMFNQLQPESQQEELQKTKQEVLSLYKRATEADPKDPTTLADYARFVYVRMNDADQAEPLLVAALKLDSTCEVALYHLAMLIHRERKNPDAAEMILNKLLKKNPTHGNGVLGLARIKADVVDVLSSRKETADKALDPLQESIELYEKAVRLVKEPAIVISEYLKFVNMYGTSRQKFNAIKTMKPYVIGNETPESKDELQSCRQFMEDMNAVLQA